MEWIKTKTVEAIPHMTEKTLNEWPFHVLTVSIFLIFISLDAFSWCKQYQKAFYFKKIHYLCIWVGGLTFISADITFWKTVRCRTNITDSTGWWSWIDRSWECSSLSAEKLEGLELDILCYRGYPLLWSPIIKPNKCSMLSDYLTEMIQSINSTISTLPLCKKVN